ncbi:SWIM zinc finger family protein [Qaidamihabitans albus]|uniref:SWIM zinc finger family protein n=1 Tax=Qaidamihabitans albus TaxID=2795733 RepID=UPI0027DD1710|nr:SWIM zinc finger family protein [Qaidamihabitans albus]
MPRRNFGGTWWGRSWVRALEDRASLDPNRLPRGRTYARKDQVGALTVEPGRISARVRGSRATPYRVTVGVHRFADDQWDVLLGTISWQAGYAAALLDAELPPDLAEHARAAGADLLPGPGDLRPRCSCPDSANPCKHAAAVCYLVADEVDADPFVLFLLRGRGRDELFAELRARRGRPAGAGAAPGAERGLAPREAFARVPGPLPARPAAPLAAGRPAVLPSDPPPASELCGQALAELAADAAARAWELLRGGGAGLALTAEEDLARRAAGQPLEGLAGLAAAAGVTPRELARRAAAWRAGGAGGLAVTGTAWRPPPAPIAEARAELAESGLPGTTTVWRNRVTRGPVQLRFGADGRWYRFRRAGGGWVLTGPGARRPLDLLADQD